MGSRYGSPIEVNMSKIPKRDKTTRMPKIDLVLAKKDDKPYILAGTADFKRNMFRPANNVTSDALIAVRDYLISTMPEDGQNMSGVEWEDNDKIVKLVVCIYDKSNEEVKDDNSKTVLQNSN